MMENIYCLDVKLDFTLKVDGLKKIQNEYKNTDGPMIFGYPYEYIDPKLTDFLNGIGLFISHPEVFYTPPGGKLPIHVDECGLCGVCKLNWIFGADGSEMVWWKPKDAEKKTYYTTPIGTKYLLYTEDECDEIYRSQVHQPSLVNVGIPHSIDNHTNEGRWCLSHNLSSKKTLRLIEWQEALEKFKNNL